MTNESLDQGPMGVRLRLDHPWPIGGIGKYRTRVAVVVARHQPDPRLAWIGPPSVGPTPKESGIIQKEESVKIPNTMSDLSERVIPGDFSDQACRLSGKKRMHGVSIARFALALLIGSLPAIQPRAACTIDEIVEMIKVEGASPDSISEKCFQLIDDAPRCSFQEALGWAQKGKTEAHHRCGRCVDPKCLPSNSPHDLFCSVSPPKNAKIGDECYCFPYGKVLRGQLHCYGYW